MTKLRNQTQGPVTLRAIDWAPTMSEETVAATAEIVIAGVGRTHVRNNGQGGSWLIADRAIEEALETYAKTLPGVMFGDTLLEMDGELLLGEMIDKAIQQYEDARFEKLTRKAVVYRDATSVNPEAWWVVKLRPGQDRDAVTAHLRARHPGFVLWGEQPVVPA